MEVVEFMGLMQKVKRFKAKLEEEDITRQTQKIILKIYIEDLTNRINTKLLTEV